MTFHETQVRAVKWLASARVICLCFAIATLFGTGESSAAAPGDAQRRALRDVTIVDLLSGELRPAQTIVWERSRIVAVGPMAEIVLGADVDVIAGEGRFVLPGLWDMHVHMLPEAGHEQIAENLVLPLYIANGVTAVREMGQVLSETDYRDSTLATLRRWDSEARSGQRVGPRILSVAGFAVDGPSAPGKGAQIPSIFDAATPEAARRLVWYFVDERPVDFIKVYGGIPRDAYFALMDEARRAGITVAGHKPLAVSFVEASDAGQRSIEHAREIILDSFPGAAELQRNPGERNLPPERLRQILDAHDPKMLREILATMSRNGTYYVPTHLTRLFDWKASEGNQAYLNDGRLKLMDPAAVVRAREDAARTRARAMRPEDPGIYREFYEKGLDITRQAHLAGVSIMAGTDAGDSYCFHGSGLHDELASMVRGGMSTVAVLRAATVTPAQYMGLSQDFGAVLPGRVADLLLLARNPLADIANTRSIEAVIFNGRLLDREALDATLRNVRRYRKLL